jgi:fimbrial chaperone protein
MLPALLGAAAFAAHAGSFEVNPVRLDLSAASRTASLTIRNTSADTVVVQTSVVAWSQSDGKDVYTPTQEILVTPPIVTIAPGAEQIIRAGLRRAPDAKIELPYRVYLQEAPPPPKPGFQGLQVALRVGLPLFVQPMQGPAHASLVWSLHRASPDVLRLDLKNEGNGHIQVAEVQLLPTAGGKAVATQSALTYVLPAQAHSWEFKITADQAAALGAHPRVKATTDVGSVESELALAAP